MRHNGLREHPAGHGSTRAAAAAAALCLHACVAGLIAVQPDVLRTVRDTPIALVELVALPETTQPPPRTVVEPPAPSKTAPPEMREAQPLPEPPLVVEQPLPAVQPEQPRPVARPAREPAPAVEQAPPEAAVSPPVRETPTVAAPGGPAEQPASLSLFPEEGRPAAPAPPPAEDVAAPDRSYLATIRNLIERHKVYPDSARRRGDTGSVTVRFTVTPAGRVSDLLIERSSGSRALDDAAVRTVRRASPLPSPPGVTAGGLPVRLTISFQLRG